MTLPDPSHYPAPVRANVTGLLLAGGLGRRMGGQDKGLVQVDHHTLAQHVLRRLQPQVGTVLINANRNPKIWAALGWPVVPDFLQGFLGPLAGLHAGLHACTTPWLACVPCDAPCLPLDLVPRLASAAQEAGAELAVASAGSQMQPVFALMRRTALSKLEQAVHAGRRRADSWLPMTQHVRVEFADPLAFRNINTPQELQALRDESHNS